MKRTQLTRLIAALLLLCTVVGLFAACNKDKEPQQTDPQDPATNQAPQNEEAAKYLPQQQDFNGYTIRMLLQTEYYPHINEYFESIDGMNGDSISQALYERDDFLQTHFNIEIRLEKTQGTGENRAPAKIRKAMDSNEDLYDIAYLHNGMRQNVAFGDMLDISGVDELNLEASYWDQSIQQDWSLDGMVFALEGDHNILDELSTMAVFYNRQLYDDYRYEEKEEYGSPYEIVEAGDWTFDLMLKMFKNTSHAADGTTLTQDDTWGCLIRNYYAAHAFLIASGIKVSQSVGDTTECRILDNTYYNRTFTALHKILDELFVNNEEVLLDSNEKVLDGTKDIYDMFFANQALFCVATLEDALQFRDMESGYGILPMPKLYSTEDGQSDYYCFVSLSTCPMYFPRTNLTYDHVERTAAIVEAMCYYSKYAPNSAALSLYGAFYDKMAAAKLCRTAEDYKMMELVYFSKAYCLDTVVEFTDIPRLSYHITMDGILNYGYNDAKQMTVKFDTLRSNMDTLRRQAKDTMDLYMSGVRDKTLKIPE